MLSYLVTPGDLAELPGAPFSFEAVLAAGESVRSQAGWHIAPVLTETLVLDSDGGTLLWLPSRRVKSVTAVRDVSGDAPVELTGWRWSAAGLLSRSRGFPVGFRAVEVDLVHGFDSCPEDLLPVVAERTKRQVVQESLGSRSVTYGVAAGDQVSRYALGPRP